MGLRSKLLFPIELKEAIDELAGDFSRQLMPASKLEVWLVQEMARSKVQCDLASDQLLVNGVRVIEKAGSCWSDDRTAEADKLGARLAKEPHQIAGMLERTKHGALYMIDKWTLLGQAIESNSGLDDAQIQTAYNLLGIDHVYRNGCCKVPAGSDKRGLIALVERETRRHQANLEKGLDDRDKSEQGMAMLGIAKERDAETRKLRSDQTRARRRLSWAWESLTLLKKGVDPSTIIDPDTRKPVAAGPRPSAAPEPVRPAPVAATPPPPPQPAPAPATPPSPTLPPLPEGCSPEEKEMWLVAAGALLSKTATPAAGEPEPPPTG